MTIAALIEATMRQAVPSETARRALAVHVADALVCLVKAAPLAEARAIGRFYGRDRAMQAPSAAAIIRMSEYDSIHVPTCLSPDAVIVPVALSLAPDIDTFAAACEAGASVGLWLAQAIGGVDALERGVWPTLFAAPAMAAVTAGMAMKLGADDLAHALAIALAGSSGRLGRPAGAPSGRWLSIGESTLKGVRAAEAAAQGFRGDLGLISPAWLRGQGAASNELPVLPGDGSTLSRIGLKPYVAARQGMNALTAFLEAADGLDAGAIDAIVVELPAQCLPVVTRPLDRGDRLSRIANLKLRIAIAALDRSRLHDPDAMVKEGDPALPLAERVEIGEATAELPTGNDVFWPARVRVRSGGAWREAVCLRGPGDDGDLAVAECVLGTKLGRLEDADLARRLALVQAGLHEAKGDALAKARAVFDHILGQVSEPTAGEDRPRRLA